ncbi:unnamed protein product [Protopolystoma xenopodis]|uniref:Uncharacterized protein n=1 Tax=Protopolystoma xenopodis TaxID=117903 RepID=A0A448WJA6_9PLAT|nr:unnamed protein product [Protopolystoma xenopodis]
MDSLDSFEIPYSIPSIFCILPIVFIPRPMPIISEASSEQIGSRWQPRVCPLAWLRVDMTDERSDRV